MGDLDRQLKTLVQRHGLSAVKDALSRLGQTKRGRRAEQDQIPLHDFTRLDAIDLLNGIDPYTLRSNTHIANRVSQSDPGHSASATHRRIMRKLASDRKADAIRAAAIISYSEFPCADHVMASERLAAIDPAGIETVKTISETLRLYRERFGEPHPAMTFEAIHRALRG